LLESRDFRQYGRNLEVGLVVFVIDASQFEHGVASPFEEVVF
jgi:hypothetical protein